MTRSLLLMVLAAGCASQPTRPAPTVAAPPVRPSTATAFPIEPSSAAKPDEAAPQRIAAWNESLPPGLEPLRAEEKEHLDKKCVEVAKVIAASAKNVSGRLAATEAAIELLKDPARRPSDARCEELMLRDLTVYRTRTIEVAAVAGLKTLLSMLGDELDEQKVLCPSAGPLPKDVQQLRQAPYKPGAAELDAWKCYGGIPGDGPVRVQYTAVTDSAAQTYRLTARVFSAAGERPTELFIQGDAQGGVVDKSAQVMRVLDP